MLLAPLALALAPQVWTVDDNGPADFADLPAAVAAASSGDTILLAAGSYTSTILDKSLRILGAYGTESKPGPYISGSPLRVDGPAGATEVTLAGVRIHELELLGVPGRMRIDDSQVTSAYVEGCADVVVSHSVFMGDSLGTTIEMLDSNLLLVNSRVTAGSSLFTGFAQMATYIGGASRLEVIASSITGGEGIPTVISDPSGGYCIWVGSGHLDIVIRGSSDDEVSGGYAPKGYQKTFAANQTAGASYSLTWSGAHVRNPPVPAVSPNEPYLELAPKHVPPPTRRLNAFGPQGAPCFVVFAGGSNVLQSLGFAGDPIRVDLAKQFGQAFMVLQGPDVGASKFYTLPTGPASVGITVDVQGVVALPGGDFFVTNQTQAVLIE